MACGGLSGIGKKCFELSHCLRALGCGAPLGASPLLGHMAVCSASPSALKLDQGCIPQCQDREGRGPLATSPSLPVNGMRTPVPVILCQVEAIPVLCGLKQRFCLCLRCYESGTWEALAGTLALFMGRQLGCFGRGLGVAFQDGSAHSMPGRVELAASWASAAFPVASPQASLGFLTAWQCSRSPGESSKVSNSLAWGVE